MDQVAINRAYKARAEMNKKPTGNIMKDAAIGYGLSRRAADEKVVADAQAISGHFAKKATTPTPVKTAEKELEVRPEDVVEDPNGGVALDYGKNFMRYDNMEGSESPVYTNLGRTALERELDSRSGIGYAKSGSNERYIGGNPIDHKKLKMLQNIGMVKEGSLNKRNGTTQASVNTPRQQAIQLDHGMGSIGGYVRPEARRLDSPIVYNGQEEGNAPGIVNVGAPARGGFFENIGRMAESKGKRNQAISDTRFNRKQSLAEEIGAADITNKKKQAEWYDYDMKSKIDSRNATTAGKIIKNAGLSEKMAADLGLVLAQTGKTEAQASTIMSSQPFKNLLLQAKTAEANARAGKAGADAELARIKVAMNQMFVQQED